MRRTAWVSATTACFDIGGSGALANTIFDRPAGNDIGVATAGTSTMNLVGWPGGTASNPTLTNYFIGRNSPATLTWSPVTGATEYEVWLITGDGTFLAGTSTTNSFTKALPSGTYGWFVVDRTPLFESKVTVTLLPNGPITAMTNFRSWKVYGNGDVFVKAAPLSDPNSRTYAREASITAALPPAITAARPLWTMVESDWFVLCLEAVDGHLEIHVADTTENRPYERLDDAKLFLKTGDLSIPRRYGADWIIVNRRRFLTPLDLTPVYEDEQYALYRP